MWKKIITKENKGEQLKRLNENIKELSKITLEESNKTLNELDYVKNATYKLMEFFGGIEGVHNLDEFLATKLENAIKESDINKNNMIKYSSKQNLKLREIIELTKRTIVLRDNINILKEYNLRLREERLLKINN